MLKVFPQKTKTLAKKTQRVNAGTLRREATIEIERTILRERYVHRLIHKVQYQTYQTWRARDISTDIIILNNIQVEVDT